MVKNFCFQLQQHPLQNASALAYSIPQMSPFVRFIIKGERKVYPIQHSWVMPAPASSVLEEYLIRD